MFAFFIPAPPPSCSEQKRSKAIPGWPVLETDNDLVSKAATGREVRVSGSRYAIRRVGTEIQTVTLAADESVSADFWQLSLVHSGLIGETGCLAFDASGSDVDEAIESLAAIDAGGVVVTRQGSGIHGDPYVHSVYFEGASTAGDVNQAAINATACGSLAYDAPRSAAAYVTTVQHGGRVERQQLTLATEAGYIKGAYFKLAYNVSSSVENEEDSYGSTDCLEWGAPASDIADALSALPAIGEMPLANVELSLNTTGMDIFPSVEVPLSAKTFVDGRLARGDVIYVSGSYGGDDAEHVVESIATDGTSVVFEDTFRAASGTGGLGTATITRVVQDAVAVARSGTGKSVTEKQRIVLTATAEVNPLSGQGFFRLQWAHDGVEKVTECLEFGEEASDVQAALEALGFDLDGSGTAFDETDEGHILVTRDGDASASSGYGYEYVFEFKGVAGISTVVGNVEQLQVKQWHCY